MVGGFKHSRELNSYQLVRPSLLNVECSSCAVCHGLTMDLGQVGAGGVFSLFLVVVVLALASGIPRSM